MSSQPIRFERAVAFVRKYSVSPKPVRVWKGHRGTRIKMWNGFLIIEKAWHPK